MIVLEYTQQDLINSAELMEEVQLLMALWATVQKFDNTVLSYRNWYLPPSSIYSYIKMYSCFIKLPISYYNENVKDTKDENFTEPLQDIAGEYVYVPHDFTGVEYTWLQFQELVSNWWVLLTSDSYLEWKNSEYPPVDEI